MFTPQPHNALRPVNDAKLFIPLTFLGIYFGE